MLTQKSIEVVYGSEKKASVNPFEKIVYPKDKENFINPSLTVEYK